ncbi:MAG: hypothetical protein ACTSUE_16610 [Promethearchaeota archaeon]
MKSDTRDSNINEITFPTGKMDSSGALVDYVDSIYANTLGFVTNFANMHDSSNATYAVITAEDIGGPWYMFDQTFQFTGLNTNFPTYQLCIYFTTATTDSISVYGGSNAGSLTSYTSIPASTSGLFIHPQITSVSASTYYLRLVTGDASPQHASIGALYFRLVDTVAPAINSNLLPADYTWYTSTPTNLHLYCSDNVQLDDGFYDLNDPAGPTDNLIFLNYGSDVRDRTDFGISTTEFNAAPQGSNSVNFYITDVVGNVMNYYTWHFSKDTVAPTAVSGFSSSHTLSTWSTDNTVQVGWSTGSTDAGGSGVDSYRYSWTHGASDPQVTGTTLSSVSTSVTSAALSDGNDWYFNIKAVDEVGHWSSVSSYGPFYIDSNGPTMSTPTSSTHIGGTWSSNTAITVNWTAASDGSGIGTSGYSYSWSNNTAATPDTSTEPAGLSNSTTLLDGLWYFNIRAVDSLGQWSGTESIGPFKIDTTSPASTAPSSTTHVTSTWSATGTINMTWTEPTDYGGSGVTGYAYSWSAGAPMSPAAVVNGTGITCSTSIPSTGIWYFNLMVCDDLGHWSTNTTSGPYWIDLEAPDVPVPASATHIVSTWTNVSSINITWGASSDSGGSGLAGYAWSWSEDIPGTPATVIMGIGTDNATNLSTGTWYFNIRARDNVGQWSGTNSIGPFLIDLVHPSISSPGDKQYVVGATGNTVTWNVSDLNPNNYTIYIDGEQETNGTWTSLNQIEFNLDGKSTGSYEITLEINDLAGNVINDTVILTVKGVAFSMPQGFQIILGLSLAGVAALVIVMQVHKKRRSIPGGAKKNGKPGKSKGKEINTKVAPKQEKNEDSAEPKDKPDSEGPPSTE